MRYEGRMKNLGRVTHLPSNLIPKRKFIPVTNPRKMQFQPPEMAKITKNKPFGLGLVKGYSKKQGLWI